MFRYALSHTRTQHSHTPPTRCSPMLRRVKTFKFRPMPSDYSDFHSIGISSSRFFEEIKTRLQNFLLPHCAFRFHNQIIIMAARTIRCDGNSITCSHTNSHNDSYDDVGFYCMDVMPIRLNDFRIYARQICY